MNMDTYGKCLALSYLISLGLAYFLGWLADIFHPLRVGCAMLVGYVLVTVWGGLFARTADSFAVALVLHCVLSGCYFTCAASLAQRLYPHTRFAQFSSAGGILTGMANMGAAPLIGVLIDRGGGVYHHTFTAGAALAGGTLLVGVYVHRKFMLLGGPKGYVAPE
jgi:MFS family permease